MEISLNGKKIQSDSVTLSELILETGFNTEALVAELNFEVVRQDDWEKTRLNEGDQIELLNFVGGG